MMKDEVMKSPTMGRNKSWKELWTAWWPALILCAWALIIRMEAAEKVFPALGDVSHFVQYGKEFVATGKLESLSALWSLAPQFLSAWSVKLGWIPQYVLQGMMVAFGVLAVTGVYALALELTASRQAAIIAGAFVATNPAMTSLAANGFSDTPHFALGTWALALAFAGARLRKTGLFAVAAVLASADLYWRPFDLFLWLGAAAPFILWRLRGCGWWQLMKLAVPAFVVGIVCAVPFFVVSDAISGWDPGRSKLSNLAIGESGTNAKELFAQSALDHDKTPLSLRMAELEREGTVRYLWKHKREIARRYPANIAAGLHAVNDHSFTGMFRLGLFWFMMIGILCAVGMRDGAGGYLWLSIAAVLGAISLGFVNLRWVIQCVPFIAILIGGGVEWVLERMPSKSARWALWLVLLGMGALNGRWAVVRLDDEWRQRNVFFVCDRLHGLMKKDERMMCFTPELPALFHWTNALDYVTLPYDTVEGVFALAEAREVDCIVLNDSMLTHFPIHEIERHPELVPAPWREVDRLEFEKETRFELEHDVWRFYRKAPYPPPGE